MNYFFVFQNKSYKEESVGGYLWAPKHGVKGRLHSHWVKMQKVKRAILLYTAIFKTSGLLAKLELIVTLLTGQQNWLMNGIMMVGE